MCEPDGNWPKKIKKVIKKITENVIRPAAKSLEKKLSQIDLTYSKGINVSGTPSAWIFNGQVGITVDTKGNVAIQSAVGGEFHVEWGETMTWDSIKFNIFDATEKFCDKVMEW